MNAVRCSNCPNPANCSPTFCAFNDADLPSMKVHMFEQQPAAQMPPSLVRAANERIRRLEAGRAHLRTLTPLRIRAWNWLGNLPHRFGRWIDRTNAGRLFCLSVGGVIAGCLASVWLVGLK